MVLSRSLAEQYPSSTSRNASDSSTACRRLRMKPSISFFTSTGTWPTLSKIARAFATVSADVHGAPHNSTIGTTCGGLTGCATRHRARPFSFSVKCDATMPDVEDASTISFGAAASSLAHMAILSSTRSGPAFLHEIDAAHALFQRRRRANARRSLVRLAHQPMPRQIVQRLGHELRRRRRRGRIGVPRFHVPARPRKHVGPCPADQPHAHQTRPSACTSSTSRLCPRD